MGPAYIIHGRYGLCAYISNSSLTLFELEILKKRSIQNIVLYTNICCISIKKYTLDFVGSYCCDDSSFNVPVKKIKSHKMNENNFLSICTHFFT